MRPALLILAVAFAAGACAATFSEPPALAYGSAQGPCSAGATSTAVSRLLVAINQGDIEAADQLVAKGDAFMWYSVGGERIGQAATDRSTLRDYLAARQAQGEFFRLIRFRYQGLNRVNGRRYANFNMLLVRSAGDFPARWILGKGAVDCQLSPPQVAVWSLGSAPVPCSTEGARMVVTLLIGAVNGGAVRVVDELVAQGDAFKWYSVAGKAGRRTGDAASNRSTLKRYIAKRRRLRERLRLIRFRYQGVTGGKYASFSMVLVRSARDFPPRRIRGTGEVDCGLSPPQLAAWSLGNR
jgi:hypothetical protein